MAPSLEIGPFARAEVAERDAREFAHDLANVREVFLSMPKSVATVAFILGIDEKLTACGYADLLGHDDG